MGPAGGDLEGPEWRNRAVGLHSAAIQSDDDSLLGSLATAAELGLGQWAASGAASGYDGLPRRGGKEQGLLRGRTGLGLDPWCDLTCGRSIAEAEPRPRSATVLQVSPMAPSGPPQWGLLGAAWGRQARRHHKARRPSTHPGHLARPGGGRAVGDGVTAWSVFRGVRWKLVGSNVAWRRGAAACPNGRRQEKGSSCAVGSASWPWVSGGGVD